ncbi:MAG TPA: hypothetical protein VFY91_08320 [Microbacterium sp.]|nr:hypothetical protein [Microbacterium sp.]
MTYSVRRRIGAAALVTFALSATALPAHAADPFVWNFPAGDACDFELTVEGTPSAHPVERLHEDSEGNPVRLIQAGKGYALTFTNESSGATFSSPSNGGATRTEFHPDGSRTVTLTGHNLLIMFPTDVPAGPTTELYVGRVTIDIDTDAVFTITSSSAKTVDVCEELM